MDSLETTPASGDEQAIRIIKDDQGILVLGDDEAVNSWLDDAGLSKQALHLGKQSLQSQLMDCRHSANLPHRAVVG
jgi:hypothetical protein